MTAKIDADPRPDSKTASPARSLARHVAGSTDSVLLLAVALVCIIFSFLAPDFISKSNGVEILQDSATIGLVAFPMTLVIVAAEIDISVGSAAGLDASLLGYLAEKAGVPLVLAIVIALAIGTAIGLGAGAIRAFFNVPSFIVTLALYGGLNGIAYLVTNQFPIPINQSWFDTMETPALLVFRLRAFSKS